MITWASQSAGSYYQHLMVRKQYYVDLSTKIYDQAFQKFGPKREIGVQLGDTYVIQKLSDQQYEQKKIEYRNGFIKGMVLGAYIVGSVLYTTYKITTAVKSTFFG